MREEAEAEYAREKAAIGATFAEVSAALIVLAAAGAEGGGGAAAGAGV